MKSLLRNTWIISFLLILGISLFPDNICLAQNDLTVDGFNIMPELTDTGVAKVNEKINDIWTSWWKVWDKYNESVSELSTSEQIASWIMSRDTIMNYLVFVVQFLSQLWLAIWAVFIMYAWYKYMLSVFQWGKTPISAIKNAIIWILIIIFSYAIMRGLTSLIWLT